MSKQITYPVRSKLDKRKARQLLLSSCTSPKPAYVQALQPDEAGTIQFTSRQEAIDRGLHVYTGKPSTLDKVFEVRGAPPGFGQWCSVRFVSSGCTAGQLRIQKIFTKEEKAT